MISPASLKDKVRNFARENELPHQIVMQNYIHERFMERIALSEYKNNFVVKGGTLIAALVGLKFRGTMDLDITLQSYPLDEEPLLDMVQQICAIDAKDGVSFELIKVQPIRSEDEYGGFRVSLQSMCGNIRTYLSVDVTTGDVITPFAIQRDIPCMFDKNKSLNVWVYNTETILAEKAESILQRGVASSRTRDFYDIYVLTKTQKYNLALFRQALEATAKHRGTYVAIEQAPQTIDLIESNENIRGRWAQYQEQQTYAAAIPFAEIMKQLRSVICETENNEKEQASSTKSHGVDR